MEHSIVVKFIDESGVLRAEESGHFSDDEWSRFRDFVTFADELGATELAKTGGSISFTLGWQVESGPTYSANLPTDDQVSAFLLQIRPFVLERERTYFHGIVSILKRRVGLPAWHCLIDQQKEAFASRDFSRSAQMFSGRVPVEATVRSSLADWEGLSQVNSEATLTKWLNAYTYHRDPEKRARLQELCGVYPLEALRPVFLSMMYDKANAIFELQALLQHVLNGRPVCVSLRRNQGTGG